MKLKKDKPNFLKAFWITFNHSVVNMFFRCPYCKKWDFKIKPEINATWCWNCRKYIR